MRSKFLFICIALLSPLLSARAQYRTVIDKEVGSIYEAPPSGVSWTVFGAFDGSAQTLDSAATRVLMAHFDKFEPAEDTMVRGFPYTALRNYEAAEVAAGKAPIFVTATYEGKVRPVLWSWSLLLKNGIPTAPSSEWQYAVNVQDSRFIHFWINQYMQPMMNKYQVMSGFGPSLGFQIDECAFSLKNYGVLDDNNNFVAGVTWDSPFPQTEAQYESGIETFFRQVKTLAPDILTFPSYGSMATPSNFPNIAANIPASMSENIMSWYPHPSAYTRNAWYAQAFNYLSWLGSNGKTALLRALIPPDDANALPTAFVFYSLLKGPNFFFAPGDGSYTTDPTQWNGMKALLGSPTFAVETSQPSSLGSGYRLFSRTYQGGVVYLNWTGATQTINLSGTWYNPRGEQVTQIQIPDGIGTYITSGKSLVLPPRIAPRYAYPAIGPIEVTIQEDTSGTTIHYTLDGSVPTASSPVYTGPFQLSHSGIVQARAYYGSESSWPSTASYTVASTSLPTVQFAVSSDTGPAGSYYPMLTLSAVPLDTVSVTYRVLAANGSSTTGTVKLPTGQTYGYFPISASGATKVSIISANGAVVGSNNSLEYTTE